MILGVFGAGGQGKEVLELARWIDRASRRWDEILFIDDVVDASEIMGVRRCRLDDIGDVVSPADIEVVIALGEPKSKKKVYDILRSKGIRFTNVIAPDANVSYYASLGEGIIIKKNAIVSPGAVVGDNSTIQAFVAVGHDAEIGCHCQISTHSVVGGETLVGDGVYIGLNVPIREKIHVGKGSVIAAGAVVLSDVPESVLMMGNPARAVRILSEDDDVFRDRGVS